MCTWFCLPEKVENLVNVFRFDSEACVLDRKLHFAVASIATQYDAAAFGRKFKSVVQQIIENLKDTAPIHLDRGERCWLSALEIDRPCSYLEANFCAHFIHNVCGILRLNVERKFLPLVHF